MRRLKRATAVAFCAAALSGAGPIHAIAADAQTQAAQTMIIMDGSGSMWGRFEGSNLAKIDAAREQLKVKIEAAVGQTVGLVSFGHRRVRDCTDVEVIAAPAADHALMLEPLAKLNPRGKGPLVAGLRAAAAALGKNSPASMIVVGDGTDNCQLDPCAAATEIAASNPGVPVHMISIGVDPADIPRLQCVAKITGGTFYDVKDSAQLSAAIDAATQLAMKTPDTAGSARPGVAAIPPQPAPVFGAALQAAVSLADNGPAISLPVHWRISKTGSSDAITESDGPTLAAKLDPGVYDVEVKTGRVSAHRSVTIETGRASSIIVALNAGRLTVSLKTDKQPAVQPAMLVAIEATTEGKPAPDLSSIERQLPLTQILPAGTYTVSLSDGTLRQTKPVTLAAGADTALEFSSTTGRVELSAGLREDGGAIEDVTYVISEDDPDSPDGRREVARSRAPTASFTLPSGTYYASARSGDGEVRQRLAVGPGDIIKRALILPLVPVKVTSLIGGVAATASQGVVYRVTALDGDRREITRSVLPEMMLSLLPGRYRIAAQIDAHHLKAAEEVAVEPGKSLNVVLKFDAGEINLKPAAGPGAIAGDAYWEITDAKGRSVWRSMAQEAKALLAPGRYTVRLDVRDKQTEAAFDVRSGERKVVEVGPK
jgi:Ca-activated chloride channel homolog